MYSLCDILEGCFFTYKHDETTSYEYYLILYSACPKMRRKQKMKIGLQIRI